MLRALKDAEPGHGVIAASDIKKAHSLLSIKNARGAAQVILQLACWLLDC